MNEWIAIGLGYVMGVGIFLFGWKRMGDMNRSMDGTIAEHFRQRQEELEREKREHADIAKREIRAIRRQRRRGAVTGTDGVNS